MGRQIYGDTDGVRLIGTDPCLRQLSSIVMAVNFPGRGARGSPFLQSFHLQVVGKLGRCLSASTDSHLSPAQGNSHASVACLVVAHSGPLQWV